MNQSASPFLKEDDNFQKTKKEGIWNSPEKGVSKEGGHFRRGVNMKSFFLYLCTSKREIYPMSFYNLFSIFKAMLLWFLSGRQSKHKVFSYMFKKLTNLGDWHLHGRGDPKKED